MKTKLQIPDNKYSELMEDFYELEKLLTERISDMYNVKGMMQARHAYIFYRRLLMDIINKFQHSIGEDKS